MTPVYSICSSTPHERPFDVGVDAGELGNGCELRPQRLVQLQGHVGVLGGIARRRVEIDLIERDLLRALADDLLVLDRRDAEVERRDGVHVMPRCRRVQHIRLEHRVVLDAAQRDAMVREDVRVVLQVVADLGRPRSRATA